MAMKSRGRQSQSGVAIVVVLIFMLALTIIAAFSARNSSVGEKVARNQLDQQVARQAAEAALRDAERDLLMTTGLIRTNALCARGASRPLDGNYSLFLPECKAGQCSFKPEYYQDADYNTADASSNTGEPWWPVSKGGSWNNDFIHKPSPETGAVNCDTFTGGVPLGVFTGAPPIAGVSRQPEYIMEIFRKGNTYVFRITSRGFGYSPSTQVVLQSYFHPFY
jgi:type IV pilus assembly protein PilX